MRWRYIAGVVGILLLVLALSMAVPLLVSFVYRDGDQSAFIGSLVITVVSGLILWLLSRNKEDDARFINQKEGMAVVALSWVAVGVFGALPFWFSQSFGSLSDAVFESFSGFTTTGASVMTDIEAAGAGLLLWRSLIQWLGGMGIIVLSLAILPFLGVGGIQLYKAEVPSPVPDKLTPRLSDSAKILWMVYAGLTALLILLLIIGGMPVFDSVCHALTTLPTGGFSPKNASIAYYDSAYIHYLIVVFMVLAGVNFSLHFQVLRGKPLVFLKDTECKVFLLLVLLLSWIITLNIYPGLYGSLTAAFRSASFQTVSILTTTGYATADYELYPGLGQVVLLACMFIGASAGSTGGGMKIARLIVGAKFAYRELLRLIHPSSIRHVKLNGQVVSEDVLRSIMGFLALYILLFVIGSGVLAAMGLDLITALGAVASCLGNIGPGFGTVGPAENYAHLPDLAKWVLAGCMLLGRLEIYTVIILIVPEFWK
jgi:trk system potassium uptake protein